MSFHGLELILFTKSPCQGKENLALRPKLHLQSKALPEEKVMPVNGGQGHSKRWYQQCFVPINAESSDDSDTESVIISNTSATTNATWEEDFLPPTLPLPPLFPSLPPPPPPFGTDIPWEDFFSPPTSPVLFSREPPPPPPPILLSTPLPHPTSTTTTWEEYFPLSPPRPPFPLWDPSLLSPPMIVASSTSMLRSAALFGNESSQHDKHEHPLISMVKISELHEKDKVPNCPICMEEFKDDDQASKLPCNHTFCYECIRRWINNNKTCPVCRLQLDDSFDQQPHQIHVPISQNDIQNSGNYFFPSSSQVSENSEGNNSDEGDFGSACEELGDSNANGDIVGTSENDHV